MDTSNVPTESPRAVPLGQDMQRFLRFWLGDRRVMIGIAVAAVIAGAALGWDWLVAAGLAPIIIGALPCVAMCAIGLCAMGKGKAACGKRATTDAATNRDGPSSARRAATREPAANSE